MSYQEPAVPTGDATTEAPPAVELSYIVPAYNEAENLEPLLAEIAEKTPPGFEVVLVDDGSTDGTREVVARLLEKHPFLVSCRHVRNLGKTAAIVTGLAAARGSIISVFDADLQFDPDDVIRQADKVREGFDLVTGEKRGQYDKRFVSAVYNRLARLVFGLRVRDINALKTFRREVLEGVHLRKDWHRYIVPLAAARGFSVTEIPVLLRPRLHGTPKYSSPFRVLIGFFDLIAVGFQLTFMRKPMLYFGTLGTVSLSAGFLVGLLAIILRLFGHGFRPLLYLVILLVLAGVLFFAAGFLGETLAMLGDRLEDIEQRLRRREREGGE
ncbi:MAG TPA: glycosyltransferase family 2 protein [candidate division WOR-3 bacterium]|uniref:Glycosyltransferase family 2 protein n=1 Tax=candidate division WOR-3 bacterium TaxID=2052148 RepID=A0A7V0T6Q2_UNCW3|nr:glycosyltransferase family 2 protein [candidate division WOR-3 bacterium]